MSERTFTEKEHFALVADAVKREVETATAEATAKIEELQSAIDRVEAEKAAEAKAKSELAEEFEQFKADIEHARQVAARREERMNRVRQVAGVLSDSYFTDERVTRWAEMSEESFETTLNDIVEVAVAGLTAEEAKQVEGKQGEELHKELAALFAERDGGTGTRETAAFTGGTSPTGSTDDTPVVSKFLAARFAPQEA